MTASRNDDAGQRRTAVVTGASRGIGRAIARELAAAGLHVVCVSTRAGGCDATASDCIEAGSSAEAHACDVTDPAAVASLAETLLAKGPVSVLVNNAGITRDGLFLRMSEQDFDTVLDTNLRGAFLLCKALARGMTKQRYGRIVNVGSIVGVRGNAGQVNYAASKAGLIGLSKSLAQELGSRGITVNVVAPGFIETDMTAGLTEPLRDKMLQEIPIGRLGTVQDVAAAVAFLSSDAASYITGQVLLVDGGMAM